MKKIRKSDIKLNSIDTDTYVLVYNEEDWDGGRTSEMSLKTKSEFYNIASQMSGVLFEIFNFYHEENICLGPFFEVSNYCKWKNLDNFDLVQELKPHVKSNGYYLANITKDKMMIENLIEGNMRYLTQSCFYLPTKRILIQVGHHTAFIVYSKDLEALNDELAGIIKNYLGWHCELESFYGN